MKAAVHFLPILGIVLAIIAPYEPPTQVPAPETLTGGAPVGGATATTNAQEIWTDPDIQKAALERAIARATNAVKMQLQDEDRPTVEYLDTEAAIAAVEQEWQPIIKRLMDGDGVAATAAAAGWARSAPAIYLPGGNKVIVMPANAAARSAEAGKPTWQDEDSLVLVLAREVSRAVLLKRYPEMKSAIIGRSDATPLEAAFHIYEGHAQTALVGAASVIEGQPARLADTGRLFDARAKLEDPAEEAALATLYDQLQSYRKKGYPFYKALLKAPRKLKVDVYTNPPRDLVPFDDVELFFNPPPTFEAAKVMAELTAHLNMGTWEDQKSSWGQDGLVFVFTPKSESDALATHLKGVVRKEARTKDGAGEARMEIFWFDEPDKAATHAAMLRADAEAFDEKMSGQNKPKTSTYSDGAGFEDALKGWTNIRTFENAEDVKQITSVFTHDRFVVAYTVRSADILREDMDEAVTNSHAALETFAKTWAR